MVQLIDLLRESEVALRGQRPPKESRTLTMSK